MSRKHKTKQGVQTPEQPGKTPETEPDKAAGAAAEASRSGADDTENRDSLLESETENTLQALREEADQLAQEVADMNDKYIRLAAELENTRRRAQADLAEASKFAVKSFAEELVNVRDSLELAQAWEPDSSVAESVAPMTEGVRSTLKQLDQVLEKFAVSTVAPARGDKLDPNLHQAMTTQESTEVAPNHIIDVIRKGYTIHDRLLRPAMVIVARAPSGAKTAEEHGKDA